MGRTELPSLMGMILEDNIKTPRKNIKKMGIIAGAGELPVLLANAAIAQDRQPVIIQIAEADAGRFAGLPAEIHTLGVGQIQKIIRTLRNADVHEIVIIGKVEKNILLRPFQVDATTLKILAKARFSNVVSDAYDRKIVAAILAHFEASGIAVLPQDKFLRHLLARPGVLTARKPTARQTEDAHFGITVARQMANMDIGQTVVVKNQMVLAVEAIEGTDKTIRRGGTLGGKGVVVAKAAAEHHDFRVDVPTVGMQTLQTLHAVKARVLAVEARRTFVMDADALIEQANRWKIAIIAIE